MAKWMPEKQKLFCLEYLKDFNASRAYKVVYWGSTENSIRAKASRLLTNANVVAFLSEQVKSKTDKLWLSVEWVLQNLQEIIERSMQKKAVMIFDKENKEYVQKTEEVRNEKEWKLKEEWVWEYDSNWAIRANELIGKYLKMFTDRIESDLNVTVNIKSYDDWQTEKK